MLQSRKFPIWKPFDPLIFGAIIAAGSAWPSDSRADGSQLTPHRSHKVLSLRSDIWCPHICDPKSDHPGYIVEIVKQILEPHGYVLDVKLINWARAINDTRQGKFAAIVGAAKEDAPDFIFPDTPQGLATFKLFTNTNSAWSYQGVGSLKGHQIGVIQGYTYDEVTNNLIKEKNSSFEIASGDDALKFLIRKLLSGRLTAIYEDPRVLKYTLKDLKINSDKFKDAGTIKPYKQDLYIGFSPKFPEAQELAKLVSKEMKRLQNDGTILKILKRYDIAE